MTTHELLRRIYLSGSTLTLATGDRLVATNAKGLSSELREQIAVRKGELIDLLKDHQIGATDEGREVPRRFVPAVDCIAQKGCSVLGPCSESLMTRPCLRQVQPVFRNDGHPNGEEAAA